MHSDKHNYAPNPSEGTIHLSVAQGETARAGIVYALELGDFHMEKDYRAQWEASDAFLILYTLSGGGSLVCCDSNCELTAGQGAWTDCREAQYCYATAVDGWHALWVRFSGDYCKAYYEIFQAKNGCSTVTFPLSSDVPTILQSLIREYRSDQSDLCADIRASGLLVALMVQFTLAAAGSPDAIGMPENIRDARAYLLEHCASPISLDDLSRRYSVNKYYFLKLFKRHTGYTPNEYIILARLNRAKELLRTTEASVAQIGLEVGIENTSHFIDLFRKREGITPAQFRNKQRVR